MSRLLNEKKAVPRPTKVLLGLALLLFAPFAVAQNNLGELLDAGAKKISPDEFRQDVVHRTLVGPTLSGAQLELMFASSGVLQGRTQADAAGRAGAILTPVDGVWNIDDSGRICVSMIFGRTMIPFRCQYWFKYKDDYFVADAETDPKAKVLRRTVKP